MSDALGRRAAVFGLGTALLSGAGQTYFIGLFGAPLRETFGMDEAALGSIYGLATLLSGVFMFWLGAMVDRLSLTRAASIALTCLVGGGALLATAPHAALLFPAFFLLRLGGQGLCGHIAIVAAAKYAKVRRGRALSIAAFGFIIGEAAWPLIVTAGLGHMAWSTVWWLVTTFVLLVGWPLLGILARPFPPPEPTPSQAAGRLDRRQLLASPRFMAGLAVVLLPPFMITAIFFHQSSIGALKGWSLADIAPAFSLYAVAQALANIGTGQAIDRWGSVAMLRMQLLPLAPALLALAWLPGDAGPWLVFALLGAMSGANQVNAGALWAELFGTEQMGMVRGVAAAIMVVATALAPPLLGTALGSNLPLTAWCLPVAFYAAFAPQWISSWLARQQAT